MNVYDIGDQIKCSCAITDRVTGNPLDPTGLIFRFKKPDGTKTTYTYGVDGQLVKTGVGAYYVILTPAAAESGQWYYLFDASGPDVSEESTFHVRTSQF